MQVHVYRKVTQDNAQFFKTMFLFLIVRLIMDETQCHIELIKATQLLVVCPDIIVD